jgi:hypothetical protein
MTDREIMEQALEALQAVKSTPATKDEIQRAWIVSDLLKRRLAQPEHEPVLLNNGRLTQYADGRIGVGTPVVQEFVIDCPRCGHCCPQRKE